MSFELVQVMQDDRGFFAFTSVTKVSLAGAAGPFARRVLSLGEHETDWILEGGVLARDLRPPSWPEDGSFSILWRTAEEPPARLVRVVGSSSEFSTDVILQLEPLEAVDSGLWRPCGRIAGEALRLTGGKLTPHAKWTWAAPRMALGSATLYG